VSTDDVRESPTVIMAETLLGKGFKLAIHDSEVERTRLTGANKRFLEDKLPHINSLLATSLKDVVAKSKTLVVCKNGSEYRELPGLLSPHHHVVDLVAAPKDAVVYFHDRILPLVRQSVPDVKFYIAGQNPPDTVKALASERVIVTGFVPDMREYVARAAVVVMPLRAGAGTKHCVFQALCMKKPVVCTAVAAEGIALRHGETAMLADDPETFAKATVSLLQDAALRQRLGERGRQLVLDRYDWRAIYERLEETFQEGVRKRK
jgi:hypothetical protein